MASLLKNKNLIVFLLLSIVYMYFVVINDTVILAKVATPVIIGVLFLFYLSAAKRSVNLIYVIVLILQMIGSIFITQLGETNFLIGFSVFFIINILLILIVTNKLSVINPNDIYKKYAPFSLIFLVIVYYIFAQIGIFKPLFLIFGSVAAIFTSLAYHYHSKSFTDSSFWLLFGAFTYLICDVFTGLYFLDSQNLFYDIADSALYLTAIYCINYAMILEIEEKENK